jgi:hypothetical protein
MASEYKKIDEYLENNSKRDFGLTSWVHADELFPWSPFETPMKELNNELSIIDWEKLGWDYEYSMSAHNLIGDPSIHPIHEVVATSFQVCARWDGMCGVYEWLWTGRRVPPRVV